MCLCISVISTKDELTCYCFDMLTNNNEFENFYINIFDPC